MRFVRELHDALEPFRGGECTVALDYCRGDADARLELGEQWVVRPTAELLRKLYALAGSGNVSVLYPHRTDIGV